MPKPEFTDSDLARWKEALASGSSLRFEQGSAALVVHSLEELETYLQLDPGTLAPITPQVASALVTVEELEAKNKELETQVATLQARIAELEAKQTLPDNALELLQSVGGLTKPKAEATLEALQKKPEA
jgi:DNA repair exonuclease SbcCD ATPase subunit